MKRIALPSLVVALVLAVAFAPVADARHRRHRHSFDVTYRLATVQTNPDGSFVLAGIGSDGSAAVVRGSTAGATITDTSITYTTKGSQRTADTLTATGNPDGSVTYSGTGKFLSGTGRFRGVTGTFTLTGTQAAGDPVIVIRVKGVETY